MRLLPARRTISSKLVLAFMVTGVVTALVALGSVWASRRSGEMAAKVYDETVMATSFARALASDFGSMRAEVEHGFRAGPENRERVAKRVDALHASFSRDLGTAVATSADAEVADTATTLRASETEWLTLSRDAHPGVDAFKLLDRKANEIEQGIDWLSYLVARKASANRDNVQSTMASGMAVAIAFALGAVVVCALTSALIGRSVMGPLKANLRFAEEVADGVYDVEAPHPSNDEFGDLTRAVATMRDRLVQALRAQELSGQLSQDRVATALEAAAEGILIVSGDGMVQIANDPLKRLLGLPAGPLAGSALSQLEAAARAVGSDRASLLTPPSADDGEVDDGEHQLSDGRWVRVSRRRTGEGALVAILADVSDDRRHRDDLAAAKGILDGALASMSQGLAVFGPDGVLRLSNARFHALTGTDDRDAAGMTHAAIAAAAARSRGADEREAERIAATEAAWCRRKGATTRTVSGDGFAMSVVHAPMPGGGFILTVEDVTRQKAAESRIHFLANHDGLTGIPNRTMMRIKVEEALARARRGRGGFAFHAINLDRFKEVNDALGHAAGDDLLVKVSERLRACVGDTHVVARLGGDEFAVLQNDGDDETAAAALARRIIASLAAPYTVMGADVAVGASVGIAVAPENGSTQGEVASAADQALQKSKEDGRGVHTFFAKEMDERARRRRELDIDLRSALASGQLALHYQPLLDAKSMRIGGFEALMRWHHPERGMISPAEFIPIAEETGLIREMGSWAVETACREALGWAGDAYVSVNVSAVQLRDPRFSSTVVDTLAKTGLQASRLELEITESSLIKDPARTAEVMNGLRSSGLKLALDDFGTGWSSLSSLHAFPFTRIKVDRSFVSDLGAGRGAEQIVKAVVLLGRTLSMQVTAEGVETRPQLAFLEEVGADVIQGWLVGRPVPATQVPGLLALHNKLPSAA